MQIAMHNRFNFDFWIPIIPLLKPQSHSASVAEARATGRRVLSPPSSTTTVTFLRFRHFCSSLFFAAVFVCLLFESMNDWMKCLFHFHEFWLNASIFGKIGVWISSGLIGNFNVDDNGDNGDDVNGIVKCWFCFYGNLADTIHANQI